MSFESSPFSPTKPLKKKLGKLARTVALAGALAMPAEACAPIHLSPSVAELKKGPREIQERMRECENGELEAHRIAVSGNASAHIASLAEQEFVSAKFKLQGGFWDEDAFVTAQALLEKAKR